MDRLKKKKKQKIRRKRHIRKTVHGSADRPRMTVYKSNRHIYVQVIDDDAGHTLASASNVEKDNRELKTTVEDAGKIGDLIGKRLKEKKIDTVVFDRNGYRYHGIVRAIADGARKTGIKL